MSDAVTVSYRQRRRKPMSEINVVPYIDVMLVLLVIFIITAPLLSQGVKVDLPEAAAKPVDPSKLETLVVTVDKSGNYFLDDRPIEASALQKKVTTILAQQPQTPVLIRGDRQVPYGTVVQAMVLLQQSGAGSVGLITEPPAKSR
ncbi:MAG: protein TolR [Thiotrichales bacterium SG8_50]|nr:MAG: protein TolR [Thiotrichales bacterium SG8_50]